MKSRRKLMLPSLTEIIGLSLFGLLIVIVGNGKRLLNYYGLDSSSQVLNHRTGSAISAGLGKIDTLGFTDRIVTFIIWAFVGIFCFSVVRAIAGAFNRLKFEEELSSNRYVHPTTFDRAKFWKRVYADFVVLFALLTATGLALYVFFAYALPVSLTSSARFLVGLAVSQIGYFALSLLIICASLLLIDLCLRSLKYRHQLFGSAR